MKLRQPIIRITEVTEGIADLTVSSDQDRAYLVVGGVQKHIRVILSYKAALLHLFLPE